MANVKTNAMRKLDSSKISYEHLEYDIKDGLLDGVSVAGKIGESTAVVFKTLVLENKGDIHVFIIPVDEELPLKTAAAAAGVKALTMLNPKDLEKKTGYIKGGCSPVGMKKLFPTFLHHSAEELGYIIVSAGKIGHQIKLSPSDLLSITNGKIFK